MIMTVLATEDIFLNMCIVVLCLVFKVEFIICSSHFNSAPVG